eukprot:COSAG05_NODE_11866_length_492_cov_1.811705_1_plen_78_part_01
MGELLYTYLGMCCPADTRCGALCMNLLMSADLDASDRNGGVSGYVWRRRQLGGSKGDLSVHVRPPPSNFVRSTPCRLN